ncbi:MAG: ISAzo13 family transposase [Thermoplasmata archaeon]|nr:ISAzo13 family transposase [Candidatus Sysuiplasma acidicola]MBX8646888.1 ISAzo13 family transposase [Candidatus Sysuiplasma acidicola]
MGKADTDAMWLDTLYQCNEVQRRRLAGVKALELGRGGLSRVCKLTGMSHHTIIKGIEEVKSRGNEPLTRLRREGGGRKRIIDKNPRVRKRIEAILEENTAGDPMSHLKWTNKSTYKVADEISRTEEHITKNTTASIIRALGFTLQSNRKSFEGGTSEERDSQFRYINRMAKDYIRKNIPFISIDAKKKELVGNFKNAGKRWMAKGKPELVNVYDFINLGKVKAIPYGIYDIGRNNGFVSVGVSSDTAEFAVASIRNWWKNIGTPNYPGKRELVICADCGGSNGSRNRLWKYSLWKFAQENNLTVTVLHYPPGTSKWNKIEHKMFSFISMNWKGKPLISYAVIINLIKATETESGLKISAKMDRRGYETGKKISDDEFKKIDITSHDVNPDWNYTIN